VRAADGSLKIADLNPDVTDRITSFPTGIDMKMHYESDLSLRCIRVTTGP
jgi:hypothetical protein